MPELGERGVQFGSGFYSNLAKAAAQGGRAESSEWIGLTLKVRSGRAQGCLTLFYFSPLGSTKMRPGASSQ